VARAKDEDKRTLILQTSKTLFAKKGFFNTSVSDIVKEANLPVGTIYTYFKNKEDIVKVIIEEGWNDLYTRLLEHLNSIREPAEKLKMLLDRFFPALFEDLDLITILLGEAIDYTRIEEKLEVLTNVIFNLLRQVDRRGDLLNSFSRKEMKAALIIYFLGVLHAAKLAKSTDIDLTIEDVMNFLKLTISESMDIPI
jgi:AcrR family transcriptional regulator